MPGREKFKIGASSVDKATTSRLGGRGGLASTTPCAPPSTTSLLPATPQPQKIQDAGTCLNQCSPNIFAIFLPKFQTSNFPSPVHRRSLSNANQLTIPQAYNSIFNDDSSPPTSTNIGNFPLLPLRTRVRGPAYTLPLDASLPANLSPEPDSESYDALDEVLSLFRANTFFRNFEIQGPADRLLIYGILWVSECLGKIRPNMSGR